MASSKMGRKFAFKVPWLFVTVLCHALTAPAGGTPTTLDQQLYGRLVAGSCPQLVQDVFEDFVPMDGEMFKKVANKSTTATTLEGCVSECCADLGCHVAFGVEIAAAFSCYKAACDRDDHCLPVPPSKPLEDGKRTALVLVRTSKTSWSEVVNAPDQSCVYGIDDCQRENEVCKTTTKNRSGVCVCAQGYQRSWSKNCVEIPSSSSTSSSPSPPPPSALPQPAKLTVQVNSKHITLPVNSATLTAFAIPEAAKDAPPYRYEWTSGPNNQGGMMENSNSQSLKLSDLKEGVYEFTVKVMSSPDGVVAAGEGTGYVRVQSDKATAFNRAPSVVVKPASQNVTLPTRKAIIDGSESTDDSDDLKGLKFKWELVDKPTTYPETLDDVATPTLTLNNLVVGSYTVSLTVEDSQGARNSTEARLLVLEQTDYPPTANAGGPQIVYLPKKTLDLYGNASIDDHGIVSWEWTRTGSDVTAQRLPVDMTDSRKPVLHLNNLEEGTYEFTLTVTDAKKQAAEDTVKVYVKPPLNLPPVAVAKTDKEISLPKTWLILDGSQSHDDVGVTSYQWRQDKGPKVAKILNASLALANATELTKGDYVFNLTVGDAAGNANTSQVKFSVKQDTNAAPVAVAGADLALSLPLSVVVINGSGSSDDLRIARWQWTRSPKSLAAGNIVGNSSREQSLLLTDLVPGQYLFSLKVWDDQGKSSEEDSISVNVHEDPNHLDVVEAVLNEQITLLTQSRLDHLTQSLNLLLSPETPMAQDVASAGDDGDRSQSFHVHVRDISSQPHTGNAVIRFIVKKDLKEDGEEGSNNNKVSVMKGVSVVRELNQKLKLGQDVLQLQILSLDTLVCQDDCSGHGSCQQSTRECICEPFWIENFVRRRLMDGKKNCEWSVVYVSIAVGIIVSGIACLLLYTKCRKRASAGSGGSSSRFGSRFRSSNGRSKKRYSRLEQTDPGMELRNAHTSSLMLSESDTDSDPEPLFNDELSSSKKRRPFRTKNGVATPTTSSDSGNPPKTTIRRANGSILKAHDSDERV